MQNNFLFPGQIRNLSAHPNKTCTAGFTKPAIVATMAALVNQLRL